LLGSLQHLLQRPTLMQCIERLDQHTVVQEAVVKPTIRGGSSLSVDLWHKLMVNLCWLKSQKLLEVSVDSAGHLIAGRIDMHLSAVCGWLL
jgi:hypothetical protein